jgi:isopentenyl-diphosphate delta-isomerase
VEEIILVNALDEEVGAAEKQLAHMGSGLLHRAFSIVLFGSDGRMLLQQRATAKYHFGGLWTNACCGHPRPGEELVEAAQRRLREELRLDIELWPVFSFRYSATDIGSGLSEQEFDHVLVGETSGGLDPNPDEIDDIRWVDCHDLMRDIRVYPDRYTPWFALLLERLPELEAASSGRRLRDAQCSHAYRSFPCGAVG